MLFVDLARTAIERHPDLFNYVKSWVDPILGSSKVLTVKEQFQERHGITGGEGTFKGIKTPIHAADGKACIWLPPTIIADIALE